MPPTFAEEVLADAPLAFWRLGETAGTTATDASGNGRHGTYTATGVTLNQTGATGDGDPAAAFSGAGGQMAITPCPTTAVTNVTIECWAYLAALPAQGCFVKVGADSNGYGVGVGNGNFDSAGSVLVALYEGRYWLNTTHALHTGWNHVALVLNASGNAQIYHDGVSVHTNTGGMPYAVSGSLKVGGYGPSRWFAGRVDEVAHYGTALSGARIAAHYAAAGEAGEPEPPPGPTVTVRTTTLEVYVHNGVEWQFDGGAYAATCSFGFDQRVAEATVRRTGGGEADVQYWSPIEIKMGCTPGDGVATRFKGYVVPVDNALFPIESVLTCRGHLYRAQWIRNQTPGGTVMAEPPTGASDESQVIAVLEECGVPLPVPANIGGTGKDLGSVGIDFDNPVVPGPFTWAEGQAGLDYIDAVDAVSVPDDASGRYRTFETLGGEIFRTKMATAPEATPDFTFTEGVDVLEARITRDPGGAANVVTVTGAPSNIPGGVVGVEDLDVWRFTAGTEDAPYLPPGLPDGPHGYPAVVTTFGSPLIEKSEIDDPEVPGNVISCESVAQFLLQEHNCVLDTLEFSTPRDDLLGPGQTIHLHSPRLGITDVDQHYWLQHLEVTVDERGVFIQRLVCLRRS